MCRSDVVATRVGSARRSLSTVARLCITVLIAGFGAIAIPTAASAAPPDAVSTTSRPHGPGSGQELPPSICRPEPPDYPGCRPDQLRPLLKALFANEYTGHAYGYRYYRMGQHGRGVIFAHLTAALNAKLAKLYADAVHRYAAEHTAVLVDDQGGRRVVVSYPRWPTWAGFRDNTTSFCTGDNVTIRFPAQYCWSITKIGQAGAEVNRLLQSTTKILLSCDGFAIGGWASGAYAGWRLGTGALVGGYYGAVGVEIGCQTTNLWNWARDLW